VATTPACAVSGLSGAGGSLAAGVRGERVVGGGRLARKDVERGAADGSRLDRGRERPFVHEPAARAVHHDAAVPQPPDALGVEDVARGVGERRVKRNDVGRGDQLVELHALRSELELRRRLIGEEGVVDHDVHPERQEPGRHLAPHAAAADEAEGLVLQLGALQLAVPLPRLHGAIRLGHAARERQQDRDGVLGGGDGVAGRHVHHHHAAACARLDIDVVDAHAGPDDRLEIRGRLEQRRGHLRRGPHDEAVHPLQVAAQLLFGAAGLHRDVDACGRFEDGFGGFGQFVGDENAIVAHARKSIPAPRRRSGKKSRLAAAPSRLLLVPPRRPPARAHAPHIAFALARPQDLRTRA
jgi:hypothetical protein